MGKLVTSTTLRKEKIIMVYPRLCIAYFCQFAIWGSWAIALGSYAGSVLELDNIGWLYNAVPLGALIAPLFIGPIADRYFAAQKVMSLLHFIGGLALLACGVICVSGMANFPLLMGLMLLAGICYMPTMGLINSVVFKHLPKASMAPYVFVFGTLGWIAVNLVIEAFFGGAGKPYFFFVGGTISVLLALYSLTLPDTPPKGAPAPGEKSSGGFGVLSLFKSFPFVIFVVCVFLASIPASNYFFPALGMFLTERGYPAPLALGTLNQISEIALMLALPFCIAKFGLKRVLLIGMAAWFIRYFCFAEPYFALVVVGLLLHGFCYPFLYVAAYMYAEKVAPAHLKASAQSMMVFLLLGVGQILGGQGYDIMRPANAPKFGTITVAVDENWDNMSNGFKFSDSPFSASAPIPKWEADEDSVFQYLDLAAQVNKLLGRVKEESDAKSVDLGKLLKSLDETSLTPQAIGKMEKDDLLQHGISISRMKTCCGEGFTLDNAVKVNLQYTKADLIDLCTEIAGTAEFSLDRDKWLAAQAHGWGNIWRIPAIFIFGCFLIFFLLGRDPKDEVAEAAKE